MKRTESDLNCLIPNQTAFCKKLPFAVKLELRQARAAMLNIGGGVVTLFTVNMPFPQLNCILGDCTGEKQVRLVIAKAERLKPSIMWGGSQPGGSSTMMKQTQLHKAAHFVTCNFGGG